MDDYVNGSGAASRFFPSAWDRMEAYEARARAVDERFDREGRQRAVGAVSASEGDTREKLERIARSEGFFVTTGQQPGLFGGPLYSVYKGLTAIGLARELEARLAVPVVPLFWVASEDHDWEEAHHTWLLDVENRLMQVAVERPAGVGDEAIHRIPVGEPLREALVEFLDALPGTDFSGPWRRTLEAAWTSESTLADGFRATMEALLGPMGMAFTAAHDPVLKDSSVPVLQAALRGAEEHERVLAERARALEAVDYHVQVPILPGGVNLFVRGPSGRERLYRDGEGFHLRHSGERLSVHDLERRLRDSPDEVSPNVLLRPVVESSVFPTLAYVAGPGEMAYFAQLQPLFESLAVGMPVIHPRFSVTVLESKVGKVLEKFDLTVDELADPFHEIASRIARDEVPPDARRILGELRGAVGGRTAELQEVLMDLDPTLKGPISHARSVVFDALGDLEKKIVQAAKRENEIALQQLEKARLHLFPDEAPQERRINPFYYVFRYGDRFLREVQGAVGPSLPSPVERT